MSCFLHVSVMTLPSAIVQERFPATFSGILIVRHNCMCTVDGGVAILYHAGPEVIPGAEEGQHAVRLTLAVM